MSRGGGGTGAGVSHSVDSRLGGDCWRGCVRFLIALTDLNWFACRFGFGVADLVASMGRAATGIGEAYRIEREFVVMVRRSGAGI